MNILHATTDPDLLTRLKQMLGSANRADIAVGYFFVSGFGAVADELSQLGKVRILVGRTDRQTLEAVALGLQQQEEQRRQDRGERRARLVHSTGDFETDRWLDDLDEDYETLSEIRERIKDIGPEDDDKLQSLERFLSRTGVKQGKVLIFSESETTIDYLFDQLNPGGKHSDIAKLSGSVSREGAANIVRRFSPVSNFSSPRNEIRILLATDVVSEGQNLQDCARVLNYDLHWNPVRLIQWFGRVDRIVSTHSDIFLHNMWPDLEVDEELALTDRLNNRIQMFHDLIGLDNRLLSDAERVNDDIMYRIYQGKELPEYPDELDEVSAGQQAQSRLQLIQRDDPDLWQTIIGLPDGIRSALKARSMTGDTDASEDYDFVQAPLQMEGAQMPMTASDAPAPSPFDLPTADETLVLLATGDIKGCYAVGNDLRPRQITPAQFVAAAECEANTQPETLPGGTNQRVMAAFEEFRRDTARRLGSLRRRSDTRNRRYLSRQLNLTLEDAMSGEVEVQNVETLRRIFLGDLPSAVESQLTEIREYADNGTGVADTIARVARTLSSQSSRAIR